MSEATTIDPRVVAAALYMETDDLARYLTSQANHALPTIEYDRNWEPTSLASFDERVARARLLLVAAHEAQAAWNEDNPPEPEEFIAAAAAPPEQTP